MRYVTDIIIDLKKGKLLKNRYPGFTLDDIPKGIKFDAVRQGDCLYLTDDKTKDIAG